MGVVARLVLSSLVIALGAAAQTSAAGLGDDDVALRFVGMSEAGAGPETWFTELDLRLLTALQQPATPNEILSRGIPFRSSQLQRLERAGFIVQEDGAFRATLPILEPERIERVHTELDATVTAVVASLRPELAALNFRLGAEGNATAFPTLINWLLRERVWATLLDNELIDLTTLVRSQRSANPDRGWWGVLWQAPRSGATHVYASRRGGERTMQSCWSAAVDEPLSTLTSAGEASRFLAALRDDGRRLKNPERFPQLLAAGVVDADGTMRAPAWTWSPDDPDSIAAALDTLATSMAMAIIRELPLGELGQLLGSIYQAEVATIAYVELVPRLLDAIGDAGFPMTLAHNPSFSTGDDGSTGFTVPIRPTEQLPVVSMVIWQRLRVSEPAIPIPW